MVRTGHPASDVEPPQLAFKGGEHLSVKRLISIEALEEFGVFG
jgi:hypothetical protein